MFGGPLSRVCDDQVKVEAGGIQRLITDWVRMLVTRSFVLTCPFGVPSCSVGQSGTW